MSFYVINLLDLLKEGEQENIQDYLRTFSCPLNTEIEDFIWNKSIDFSKQKISITHLVHNSKQELCAFFSLTQKSIIIDCNNLSATMQKKLRRYGIYDAKTNSVQACAYLIAQFGKNMLVSAREGVSGDDLMEMVFSILKRVQHSIGGGIAFLECEDKKKLLDFYQNQHNKFFRFAERSEENRTKYIQLMQIFSEKTFAETNCKFIV